MMCMAARAALLLAAWLAALQGAAGCSCMPSHPQEHFCKSDFVILTRVKKEIVTDRERIYRTVVKRIFKASEKDAVTVSAGKIWTARDGAMCGVELQTNRTYVLAGHMFDGKAHIGLCNLYLPWDRVSPKQRKGFRLMYRQSCHCKVFMGRPGSPEDSDSCAWETYMGWGSPDCQAEHAICMRQPGTSTHKAHCGWTGGSRYRQCMGDRIWLDLFPKEPEVEPQTEATPTPEITLRPEVIPAPEPQRRQPHRHVARSNRMPRRT